MSDPYKPPSQEEVEASGAADWVDQALEVHERKQQRLSNLLEPDREALRKQKEAVQQMWSVTGKGPVLGAGGKEEAPAPDVFGKEAAKNQPEPAKLSSVFDEDLKARAAEEDQLRNFFGGGGNSSGGSKSKKPRK